MPYNQPSWWPFVCVIAPDTTKVKDGKPEAATELMKIHSFRKKPKLTAATACFDACRPCLPCRIDQEVMLSSGSQGHTWTEHQPGTSRPAAAFAASFGGTSYR